MDETRYQNELVMCFKKKHIVTTKAENKNIPKLAKDCFSVVW